MVYIPPSREALHQATLQLVKRFNLLSHRYVPPAHALLCEKALQLKRLYSQRVAEKPPSYFGTQPVENKAHIDEIECITRLVVDLPATKAGSAEQDEAQSIILGALIYRYLAIEFEYTKTLDGRVLSWLGVYNKDSAALYGVLKMLLGINEQNQLDPLSIATRCSAYLEHLRTQGVRRGSGYIRQEEKNFFDRLNHFIFDAREASNPIAEQIKSLAMIQSVDSILCKTEGQLFAGFGLFSEALAIAFKSKSQLSRAEMVLCLKAISPLPPAWVLSMMDYLLRDSETLIKDDLVHFVADMRKRWATYSQYTVLGVYVVALTKSNSAVLTSTIDEAMRIEAPNNLLDDSTRVNALSALGYFLRLPLQDFLDDHLIGNYHALQHDIEALLLGLRGMDHMLMSLAM